MTFISPDGGRWHGDGKGNGVPGFSVFLDYQLDIKIRGGEKLERILNKKLEKITEDDLAMLAQHDSTLPEFVRGLRRDLEIVFGGVESS